MRKLASTVSLTLTLLALISAPALAQVATVAGRIRTVNNQAAPNVVVVALDSSGHAVDVALTNRTGHYVLKHLPAVGHYHFVLHVPGSEYQSGATSLDLKKADHRTLDWTISTDEAAVPTK